MRKIGFTVEENTNIWYNLEYSCCTLFLRQWIAVDGSPLRGDIMVTWEALTCMFTFGLMLVAVIAPFNGKK